MSKYNLAAMPTAQYDLAGAPYLGCHWAMFATITAAAMVGEVNYDGTTAVWTPNPATILPATPTGADLQCVTRLPLVSPLGVLAPTIVFAGKDNTATPVSMLGTATFNPPAWAQEQGMHFQSGYAVDLAPAVGGKTFTSIVNTNDLVTPVLLTNVAAGATLRLYQLPDINSFKLIGGVKNIKWAPLDRIPKNVASGSDSSKWSVAGMTEQPAISFDGVFRGYGDMPSRFGGVRCTLMAVGLKDGSLTGDRIVFPGALVKMDISGGDGEGESVIAASGTYRDILAFPAL